MFPLLGSAAAWDTLVTMNTRDDNQERRAVRTVSTRLVDGGLLELVYQAETKTTAFAIYRKGVISIESSLKIDDGHTLVPIPAGNNLIHHEALLLPEKPESFGTVVELVKDIQAYIARYLDLTDQFRQIASYYVILTWVYDAFNELPYLRFRGGYGSGKTRALTIIGSLCYKAFMAGGASTVSPIFHTLDTFQGTLVLDEADFRFSDATAELVKIFNNGNIRGFPVLRTAITVKHDFDPRAFTVFGPKIVAMRGSFEDQALESRFLTEEMGQRSLRKDIPLNLPDEQKEKARALRNKLLMYRFEKLGAIKVDESLVDPELSPRLNQILVPLLSVIDDEALRNELCATVRSLDRALAAERGNTLEADMLQVLAGLMAVDTSRKNVPVAEITAGFSKQFGNDYPRPITHRYVGEIIRKRLRLITYKSHGVYVVPMSEKDKVDHLCIRYGITERDQEESG